MLSFQNRLSAHTSPSFLGKRERSLTPPPDENVESSSQKPLYNEPLDTYRGRMARHNWPNISLDKEFGPIDTSDPTLDTFISQGGRLASYNPKKSASQFTAFTDARISNEIAKETLKEMGVKHINPLPTDSYGAQYHGAQFILFCLSEHGESLGSMPKKRAYYIKAHEHDVTLSDDHRSVESLLSLIIEQHNKVNPKFIIR